MFKRIALFVGGGNLAVSLTSYPPRIGNLWMTIHSLFRQTILPGHIVLYLSHEDFPKGKENITGYEFENWHIRFVGKDNAKIIYENDLTLEEYIDLYIKKY